MTTPLGAETDRLRAENERLEHWVDDLQDGGWVNCVYCGQRYGERDEQLQVHQTMREALAEHVESCPKHPMAKLKAERDKLKAELERLRRQVRKANVAISKHLSTGHGDDLLDATVAIAAALGQRKEGDGQEERRCLNPSLDGRLTTRDSTCGLAESCGVCGHWSQRKEADDG